MVDINTKFQINKEEDSVILVQEVSRTMTEQESFKEFESFKQQVRELETEKAKLEKEIEDKVWEKSLEKTNKQLSELMPLWSKWEDQLKEYNLALTNEIISEAKPLLLDKGYKRTTDKMERMSILRQVLAPIFARHELRMDHEVAIKAKEVLENL